MKKTFFAIVLALAVFFASIGIKIGLHVRSMEAHGVQTSGKIVKIQYIKDPKGKVLVARTLVQYKTTAGKTYTFISPMDPDLFSDNMANAHIGGAVKVLYRANAPQDAVIDHGANNWVMFYVAFLIAFIFALLAWKLRPKTKPQSGLRTAPSGTAEST